MVVGVDLSMRMGDGRPDFGAPVLEDQNEIDVVALAEGCGSLGPQVDDLAHPGHAQ